MLLYVAGHVGDRRLTGRCFWLCSRAGVADTRGGDQSSCSSTNFVDVEVDHDEGFGRSAVRSSSALAWTTVRGELSRM